MSWLIQSEPDSITKTCPQGIEQIIIPRTSDVGNFEVYRALPSRTRRLVGPFIFWDQMGPGEFLTGQGLDVRPHPHIGLATLTFLLDGEIIHRDSLGVTQRITPGDVNLMTAGNGIVHSERTDQAERVHSNRLFGIQSWLALPKAHEERAPAFEHIPKGNLPRLIEEGKDVTVIAGNLYGVTSPVPTYQDTVYAHIKMEAGQTIPVPATVEERAIYILKGDIEVDGTRFGRTRLLVLRPGDNITVKSVTASEWMLLGGAAMDGPRHIWWNFVSSSRTRIQEAKAQWQAKGFPLVPGDDKEFIPLPKL